MLDQTNPHLPKLALLPSTHPVEDHSKVSALFPPHKRLLIISQFYPPDYAATGQLIAELVDQLSHLGLNIRIFTGQPGYAFENNSAPKEEQRHRVTVQRSRTSRLWPLRIRGRAINGLLFCVRTAAHLLRCAKSKDLLLITTEPPYLPIIGYIAHCLLGVKYICLLYDLYPDVAVQLGVVSRHHWLVRLWDKINRKIWQKSEAVIVLSSSMKERILHKAPNLEHKISVIPSWSDPNLIHPLDKHKNWFAAEHNLTDTFVVQYSGNLGRCHDLETILMAAELLKDEPVRFVFIGQGAKLDGCLQRVQGLGLNNCQFLPYQDKSVLPYSLTACDLSLVSISPGLEGIVAPSKLYGILAAGRPVAAICEPHSYLRELLGDAKCGQAFLNGDGEALAQYIRYLMANPQLAKSLGRSGRRYLKANFTPDIVALQYLQVLAAAAGE
ncbi:glycosyltransferase family 4 protein [Spirulina subsalsa FACHB-351]|uniref:Glycosyltransferase family 4 protein n=1 Tax=Spirulina subsalsa FACHB-351 TaxID=234711 RepID=A0ABT3LBK9_9CYAN|nr:glycosyltransferase family 4 protein [Spirulina subsalsa FACHB-351]